MWVKFFKRSKRQAEKAARAAGYVVITSGRCSDGKYVYFFSAIDSTANVTTLADMLTLAGATEFALAGKNIPAG